ncbi:hypothetical protein ACS0TY_023201 [Phlomoides rotata]
MISTQRSEGMNAYFDDFVHSRSTLKQFMQQYDIAMGNKIQKEFQADFQSKNKVIKCISEFQWEGHFQATYTNSIFTLVQEQVKHTMYCHVLERSIHHITFLKEFTYTVEWKPREEYINCNCRKFEFKGILCCHIMKVLAQKNIQEVNERYFLRGYPHMTEEYKKYQIIEKQFQHCADLAMGSIEKMEFIEQQCNAMKSALLN